MVWAMLRPLIAFGRGRVDRWPEQEMYCPHPYTNWGLNPAFVAHGQRLHTEEGFRKTVPCQSLLDWLAQEPNRARIYVLGQSSTYCTNLLQLGQAWPDKLAAMLECRGVARPLVVNAAVGGHSSYQSLIRFLAWGPAIQPALTIVYTSKNDFTPIKASGLGQERIAPDHQNIVAQYGWAMARHTGWRRPTIGLAFDRKGRGASENDPAGLWRCGPQEIEAVLGRYVAMADLASQWNGKVLFVTEVICGSAYRPFMEAVNDALPQWLGRHRSAGILDVRQTLPQDDRHFADKLHLTEQGCSVLAGLIANTIADHGLLREAP